jgi:hypothetical protein
VERSAATAPRRILAAFVVQCRDDIRKHERVERLREERGETSPSETIAIMPAARDRHFRDRKARLVVEQTDLSRRVQSAMSVTRT